MGSQYKVVDAELALERVGGNADLAKDLYQMLQKELPLYLEKLPTLFNDNDITNLKASVHKLHGSATYCGVPALRAATNSFESCLKSGESEKFQQEMDALIDAIHQLLKQPTLPL